MEDENTQLLTPQNTQIGMTEIIRTSEKSYVFNVVIDPIGRLYQVIFCRKRNGRPGWFTGQPHYVREGSASLKRAYRAMLAASTNVQNL